MTKSKKTCIACNNQKEKNELVRIVKPKDEELQVDSTGKKNGRGAYICKSEECLNKAIKSKRFEKTFEVEINEDFYESLKRYILG